MGAAVTVSLVLLYYSPNQYWYKCFNNRLVYYSWKTSQEWTRDDDLKRKITHLLRFQECGFSRDRNFFFFFFLLLFTVWGWKYWVVGFNWQEKSKVLGVSLSSPAWLCLFSLSMIKTFFDLYFCLLKCNKVVNIIYFECVCCFINICITCSFIGISCNNII